jgi:hypothetical protein
MSLTNAEYANMSFWAASCSRFAKKGYVIDRSRREENQVRSVPKYNLANKMPNFFSLLQFRTALVVVGEAIKNNDTQNHDK